jgi:hypothetical protein
MRTFWLVLAFGIPAAGFAAIGVVEARRRWSGGWTSRIQRR